LTVFLLSAAIVGSWDCRRPGKELAAEGSGAQAPVEPDRRWRASPDEDVYTILLPVDPGLVAESDYADALVATLTFRKASESLNVGLKVKGGRIHVSSFQKSRYAFEREDLVKKEEAIEEQAPGEPRRPEERKEAPPLFDAATGQGIAGGDRAYAELAREIRARGREALVVIDARADVPAGLVLEAFRRGSAETGVVSVAFTGARNPLEEEFIPIATIWKEDADLSLHTDDTLLHDASDGFPVMLISEASGNLRVDLPFPLDLPKVEPGEGEEGEEGALARLTAVMKAFGSRGKDPKDPRVSNGWLVVRLPAETPYGVLQAMMQAACNPEAGLRKIRFLLPRNHAFKGSR
jgi:hypothetical protein